MNVTVTPPKLAVVGTRPIRPDGVDKVTGRANYGADYKVAGMLHGKILRSPHAHARIVSIDTKRAEALKGVKAVITGKDFPLLGDMELPMGEAAMNVGHISENCIARDKALYQGHAIAAVAATTAAIAEDALELIDVTYEVLPHVLDVEAAMAPGAPLLHEKMLTKGVTPPAEKPSNVAMFMRLARGDAAKAIDASDVIVEGRYDTAAVHQGYIEPHACVCTYGADGQVVVWSSSQGQFMVRSLTSVIAGIDQADIKAIPAEIGGGFGGKTLVYLEPLATILSKKSGRAVKMVMSRDEVFRASGPTSSSVMTVRAGATKDGKFTGFELDLRFAAGAYPGSPVFAALMAGLAHYELTDFAIDAYDVVTNTPKVAAYRAPGAPISTFAVESAIDDLAIKLGMDPIALRVKNGVKDGSLATYGVTFSDIGFHETLESIRNHEHYSAPLGPNQGRGVAAGYWFNAGGESSANIAINEDGTATVVSGCPDIGGSRASMAIMAAEVLGLPIEKVRCTVADTTAIAYSGLTGGSRVTVSTGAAVVKAANDIVEQLKGRAAITWDVPVDQVEWSNGAAICLSGDQKGEKLSLADLAYRFGRTGGPVANQASVNLHGIGPGFAVHLCDVEVDPETGGVTVLRYTAAQDVGRAIHASYVEGQMQGGAAQGIGWALNEEYIFDTDGKMENPGFLDYRMPVASDLPMIDTIMIEVPCRNTPFGAKGVGEVPIVPPLAAVANAVRAAIGKRPHSLPLSPPRLHALMANGH